MAASEILRSRKMQPENALNLEVKAEQHKAEEIAPNFLLVLMRKATSKGELYYLAVIAPPLAEDIWRGKKLDPLGKIARGVVNFGEGTSNHPTVTYKTKIHWR